MPDSIYSWWLPPDYSTHGAGVDRIIDIVHWFMAILFVAWGIFFVYCLIRFRERTGHRASYALPKAKVTKWAEGFVALFEIVLLLGFSMPVWAQVKSEFPNDKNPFRVRVVAEQFAWNFHYPGPDGKFGRTDPYLIGPFNLIGLDRSDTAAKDDVVTNNEFAMPVDRPVIIDLTSKDVIHSFSIPVLRVKQDVIPGMKTPIWFEATQTGHFQVACAQLCGNNHYKMFADLRIQTEEEFAKWFEGKASSGGEEEEEEE